MADIVISKFNESFGYLLTDDYSLAKEIWEATSFWAPGYRFMPSYINGWFDGRIRLMNLSTRMFPLGLSEFIYRTARSLGASVDIEKAVAESFVDRFIDETSLREFFNSKKFYSKKEQIFPREEQIEATIRSIKSKRCVNICPTSFGKSISITMECLWFISRGLRCLIIVPTKDLVDQFASDILDYATSPEGVQDWYPKVQIIYSGQKKELNDDTDICISTWQSLSRVEDEEYMNQFDVIILDECHKSAASALTKLMNLATAVQYRTGWTGTLSNDSINELQVVGSFGPPKQIITTKELMDKNVVADLSIVVARLMYPEDIRHDANKLEYQKQLKFIETYDRRNIAILNIIKNFPQTGLLLYKHIKHGEFLYEKAREMFPDRNVYLIHGGYFMMNDKKYKTFEDLKTIIEEDTSGVVIANYQVTSTGISIKNLRWLMFGAPVKSFITTIQSIGRVLRISKTKNKAVLIDIVDDFSVEKRKSSRVVNKMKENYAVKHFAERFQYYNQQQFEYVIHNMSI